MHVLHITILQYNFVYSSNQERCQLKSTEEGAHFSFRLKFGTDQMTTTVLVCIKNKCENIVEFFPWLQIAFIVPARLVNVTYR